MKHYSPSLGQISEPFPKLIDKRIEYIRTSTDGAIQVGLNFGWSFTYASFYYPTTDPTEPTFTHSGEFSTLDTLAKALPLIEPCDCEMCAMREEFFENFT